MSGSASERVAVVTASGRSLPALMCSIDAGRLSRRSGRDPLGARNAFERRMISIRLTG
jgi:hypothetical protein